MKHIYLQMMIGLLLACCSVNSYAQSDSSIKIKGPKIEKTADIKIFPNPTTDRFTINISSEAIKYITINDIIGKEIKKLYASPNLTFEVSDLKRGVYIVRIFNRQEELIKALRLSKT